MSISVKATLPSSDPRMLWRTYGAAIRNRKSSGLPIWALEAGYAQQRDLREELAYGRSPDKVQEIWDVYEVLCEVIDGPYEYHALVERIIAWSKNERRERRQQARQVTQWPGKRCCKNVTVAKMQHTDFREGRGQPHKRVHMEACE